MKEQHKKESPVLSLLGMGGGGTGTALGGLTLPKKYVDDVFGTFLYEGTGSARTINNGIDLAGEGGLVWTKARSTTIWNHIADTERGAGQTLYTNNTDASGGPNSNISAFNSNGFTVGANTTNQNGEDFVSWTFRKAPGFFDIVTYTGNQTTRTIAHNLGSVPGMVVVKKTSGSGSWEVYHRSTGNEKTLRLNSSNAQAGTTAWNDTTPTSTHFTLSSSTDVNETGSTYIAYIFAHDDQSFGTDGDESIIKCGSYTGNGSATGPTIDLGFEPQWVILKPSSGSGQWQVYDTMRGWTDGGKDKILYANLSDAEDDTNTDMIKPFSTGFQLTANFTGNSSGVTYIYMAMRRPHKPPEAAINVFDDVAYTGTGNPNTVPFSPAFADLIWIKNRVYGYPHVLVDRLRGDIKYLSSDANSSQLTLNVKDSVLFDKQESFKIPGPGYSGGQTNNGNAGYNSYISWVFKRAPGFFDVVTYDGNQAQNRQVPHNLDAVPEMMLVKSRDSSYYWVIYHKDIGAAHELRLPNNNGKYAANSWSENHTVPTDSYFVVGNTNVVNDSSDNFIAYLFASLPGISKVGSYTGTGNAINVPCGFTNGARFVLIKRADSSGDWYLWDTARGIVSGNDPYILLNSTAVEVTNTDYVDPLTSGFTVTASAPAALNASGGTYIFLAIA